MNNITIADLSTIAGADLVVLSKENHSNALAVMATVYSSTKTVSGVDADLLLKATDLLRPVFVV